MPRVLSLAPHLRVAAIETQYRTGPDPVGRRHWQLIWLIAHGARVPEAAAEAGYSVAWARTLVHRYTADGPRGLDDRRHHNPGHPPLLTPALRADLAVALTGPAPEGRPWTSTTVAAWMAVRLGRAVAPARGWEALRALGYTAQRRR